MSRAPWPTAGRLLEYLAAIVGGNAVYFLLLYRHLPRPFQHAPFRIDRGLLADLFCCAVLYAGIRLGLTVFRTDRRDPFF